jgi:hypothetical protein
MRIEFRGRRIVAKQVIHCKRGEVRMGVDTIEGVDGEVAVAPPPPAVQT